MCLMEMCLTSMHSLAFLACGSAHCSVLSAWQSITMKHCIVVKQWHLYEASLNEQKHLARDGNNNHKKRQGKKTSAEQCQAPLRGNVFDGAWWFGVLRRFLFSHSHLFEVSVTFLSTSCFLRWETVPTLFKQFDPSFPSLCALRPVC